MRPYGFHTVRKSHTKFYGLLLAFSLVFQSCDKAPHKFYCFVTNWAVQEPGLRVVSVEFEKVRLTLELSHFVAEDFVKTNTRY